MVVKCPAVCLVALSLLCSFCDGQWSGFYRPSPRAYPIPRATVTNPNTQGSQDVQQTQIGPPLKWHYPVPPQGENIPVGPNVPIIPIPPTSVAVECREKDAYVEVKEDFFGNGQLINPLDLTLGTCSATAEDSTAKVLIFDAQLQDCGSTLSMTNDSIIYSFILNYNPHPVGNIPVVRSSSTGVIVQCHYPRMQNVSSLPILPMWSPFSAVRVAQEYLYFNMTLMTSDWKYLRPNNQYTLGDMINIQVSVMQYFHVPLRIYVDSCIATTSTDLTSSPSYIFIANGCMLDGILTGSASQFMNRTVNNKLQFQLDAFMFQGETSGSLYITCHLVATTVSYPIDATHRACSYINRWIEASGVNTACASCSSVASTGTGTVTGSSGGGVGTTGGGVGTTGGTTGGGVGTTGGTTGGGVGTTGGGVGTTGGTTGGGVGTTGGGVGTTGGTTGGGVGTTGGTTGGTAGGAGYHHHHTGGGGGYPGASYHHHTVGGAGYPGAGYHYPPAGGAGSHYPPPGGAGSHYPPPGGAGSSGTGYPYPIGGGAGSSGTGVRPVIGHHHHHHHHHPIHTGRKTRDVSPNEIFEWEAEVCLGPLQIREKMQV